MTDDNPRLIRLEENVFFLERKIGQLDEQILLQHQQVTRLEREISEMRDLLMRMKDTDEKRAQASDPEIPPHYHSTGWHGD